MLKCREIAQLSSDYVDRELSLAKRLQFRMHLFLCVHCKRYISNLTTALQMFGRKKLTAQPDQVERVLQSMKQSGSDSADNSI